MQHQANPQPAEALVSWAVDEARAKAKRLGLSRLSPTAPTRGQRQTCTKSYPGCRTPSSRGAAHPAPSFTGTFLRL